MKFAVDANLFELFVYVFVNLDASKCFWHNLVYLNIHICAYISVVFLIIVFGFFTVTVDFMMWTILAILLGLARNLWKTTILLVRSFWSKTLIQERSKRYQWLWNEWLTMRWFKYLNTTLWKRNIFIEFTF